MVIAYAPAPVSTSPDDMARFLRDELAKIAASVNARTQLEVSYAPPPKPRDGVLVLADGVFWDPGSGAGFYGYRAGAWRFLG